MQEKKGDFTFTPFLSRVKKIKTIKTEAVELKRTICSPPTTAIYCKCKDVKNNFIWYSQKQTN